MTELSVLEVRNLLWNKYKECSDEDIQKLLEVTEMFGNLTINHYIKEYA